MERKIEELPEDLQRQIWLRSPLKSLAKCMCVSKKLGSIILERSFRDEYLKQSMERPRVLFLFCRKRQDQTRDFLFHSVYQEEEPLLSSGQQQLCFSLEGKYDITKPIRGLICLQSRKKLVICNPGINKFLTLPQFVEPSNFPIKSYFGYDEDTDVFKVLGSTLKERAELDRTRLHQVFTVGSEAWRPIVCKHHHHPVTQGLCKGGVLYYGAWGELEKKIIVMCFNVRSEELTVIDMPKGAKIYPAANLVNYNGDIALVTSLESDFYVDGDHAVLQIWVMNEISREWRQERILIHGLRETLGDMNFSFQGTTGTGELVFARYSPLVGSYVVVYYDRVTQNLRKFQIEGVGDSFHAVRTFLNHVDSVLLM